MTEALEGIRGAMVGLKMPRALEALDHTMQQLEQGKITAIEAIDSLLSEEYSTRETRRIDVALKTSKLMPPLGILQARPCRAAHQNTGKLRL